LQPGRRGNTCLTYAAFAAKEKDPHIFMIGSTALSTCGLNVQ
jgi:hypothetical protein